MDENRPYSQIFQERIIQLREEGFSYAGERVSLDNGKVESDGLLDQIRNIVQPGFHPDRKQELVILETPDSSRKRPIYDILSRLIQEPMRPRKS